MGEFHRIRWAHTCLKRKTQTVQSVNFKLSNCRNYKQDSDEEESEEESEEECSEDDDEDEEENDYKAMGHSCECLRENYLNV